MTQTADSQVSIPTRINL